ncbi:MAG: hypothetical protein LBG61_04285 [Burkholderiales bacterium]|jgi:hypothetical protein|nr:hypothetical protein [Burkholderiales bacterium]
MMTIRQGRDKQQSEASVSAAEILARTNQLMERNRRGLHRQRNETPFNFSPPSKPLPPEKNVETLPVKEEVTPPPAAKSPDQVLVTPAPLAVADTKLTPDVTTDEVAKVAGDALLPQPSDQPPHLPESLLSPDTKTDAVAPEPTEKLAEAVTLAVLASDSVTVPPPPVLPPEMSATPNVEPSAPPLKVPSVALSAEPPLAPPESDTGPSSDISWWDAIDAIKENDFVHDAKDSALSSLDSVFVRGDTEEKTDEQAYSPLAGITVSSPDSESAWILDTEAQRALSDDVEVPAVPIKIDLATDFNAQLTKAREKSVAPPENKVPDAVNAKRETVAAPPITPPVSPAEVIVPPPAAKAPMDPLSVFDIEPEVEATSLGVGEADEEWQELSENTEWSAFGESLEGLAFGGKTQTETQPQTQTETQTETQTQTQTATTVPMPKQTIAAVQPVSRLPVGAGFWGDLLPPPAKPFLPDDKPRAIIHSADILPESWMGYTTLLLGWLQDQEQTAGEDIPTLTPELTHVASPDSIQALTTVGFAPKSVPAEATGLDDEAYTKHGSGTVSLRDLAEASSLDWGNTTSLDTDLAASPDPDKKLSLEAPQDEVDLAASSDDDADFMELSAITLTGLLPDDDVPLLTDIVDDIDAIVSK